MKHIESIQPEYAAEELERIVREEGDATASAALTALLHSVTGCAIPPLATTPESEVEELVPLCLSILRRHWQTPLTALGDGTTPMSLADLMRRLIGDRVQGNESLGIPPANADIPTAVAALLQRKIGGVPQAPDGISLVQLLASTEANDSVTELVDDNRGWVMTKAFAAKNYFLNSSKVQLGCGEIRVPFEYAGGTVFDSDEEYKFTALKKITPSTAGGFGHGIFNGDVQSHDIDLGDLEEIETGGFFGLIRCSGSTTDHRYALIARKLRKCPALFSRYNDSQIGITKVVLGKIEYNFQPYYIYGSAVRTPNLIHFEFGEGTSASLDLKHWIPTTALSERLDEFLSNFKTYIAQRLTDHGSGLTLTLSQAVRDAIQTDPEIVSIITSKGWTISPAPSV